MLYFQCDYTEGAHPEILRRLQETNLMQTPGYGLDEFCDSARARIRAACERPDAAVHFLVGGTQTNATVIAALLRPHQGALCADEGHIACHETGAIEATGHKVLALPSKNGTISAAQVDAYCREHEQSGTREHTVQPGLVYISLPTESGTLYAKAELRALHETCRKWRLPLFVDGARLGYGLASPACDVTLPELARLCDAFYLGGTKCGALFGEAVVFPDPGLAPDFRYFIKQHGGMLAKGRLLGLQFDTLMTGGLYFSICRRAVEQALAIRAALEARGVALHVPSFTNQQFPILSKAQQAYFAGRYLFEFWGAVDAGHDILRICTSWATRPEAVDALIADIRSMPA